MSDSLTLGLSEDGKTAILGHQNHPLALTHLDAGELTNLIETLSRVRAGMKPSIPVNFETGGAVMAQIDPSWATEVDLSRLGVLMHLRNPGTGWLHSCFSPDVAEKLGQSLVDLARSQRELQDKSKNARH